LIWAGESETIDPKDVRAFAKQPVDAISKEMRTAGLVSNYLCPHISTCVNFDFPEKANTPSANPKIPQLCPKCARFLAFKHLPEDQEKPGLALGGKATLIAISPGQTEHRSPVDEPSEPGAGTF